jgi:hypothetical protein
MADGLMGGDAMEPEQVDNTNPGAREVIADLLAAALAEDGDDDNQ